MQETRRARLESVMREELSLLIRREIKDPRVPSDLTITHIKVTQDADHATILVSSFNPINFTECIKGLESATPFFRRHLAKILKIKNIPHLTFKEDKGLENSLRVGELLQQIEEEKKSHSS